MDHREDPRATKIVTSGEQRQVVQILDQIQRNQHVNAFFVLSKFIDCGDIKNEPQFCEILFHDHTPVVMELFEWMLTPKLIAAKKKLKTKVDPYPYQCRQFMKDNWGFYEQMYIASRNKKIQFSQIFNFLRKDYFDKETIFTALGYFADVMIPFAKYQFSGSFNLSRSLEISTPKHQQTLSIMKILPQSLIEELVSYCHYQPIFQFLKTSILVSIEDPRDYEISKQAALKLMKAIKIPNIFTKFPPQTPSDNEQLAKSMDMLQNISYSLKQITQNIEAVNVEIQPRTFTLIKTVLQSNVIINSVTQLTKSRLCGSNSKEKDRLHSSANFSENANSQSVTIESPNQTLITSLQLNTSTNQISLPPIGALPVISDSQQQDLVQTLLKILSSSVEIYTKIPKKLNIFEERQENMLQLPESEDKHQNMAKSATKPAKQKPRQTTYGQYSQMLTQFQKQIQYILNNMQMLTKFVYNEGEGATYSKVIPFASGENVKAITFMKLQFFRLLYNCLVMLQVKEPDVRASTVVVQDESKPPIPLKKMKSISLIPFDFRIQKVFPIEIIKKYLNQNRWNNLAHHVLEKICHLLIIGNYEYIKKNIQKDKNNKFSDSFLAYLIENFTKRDFIFLNTVKFTTQGNLYSLYSISKDLAYTLKSTNQLVLFINQFEPWKKFLMTDLKNYQERAFPKATKPEVYQKNQNEVANIQVDEVDSIKKLIQNIQVPKKWPLKLKNKNMSKSGIFQMKKSGDQFLKSETKEHIMMRTYGNNSTSKKLDLDSKEINTFNLNLEDSIVRKIRMSKKGSTQIQEFQLQDDSAYEKPEQIKKGSSEILNFTHQSTNLKPKSHEDI